MTIEELEARQSEVIDFLLTESNNHPDYEKKINELNFIESQLFIQTYERPGLEYRRGLEEKTTINIR